MARPILKLVRAVLLLVAALSSACAGTNLASTKYPRRGPGCEIALYRTSVPGVTAWDDLGIAEVSCHVSTSVSSCIQSLKAEGCAMGGDLIYNVPREPLRPQDQVLVFRGQVAHTRTGGPTKRERDPEEGPPATGASDEAEPPPPASPEEAALPVVPLTGPAAPKTP